MNNIRRLLLGALVAGWFPATLAALEPKTPRTVTVEAVITAQGWPASSQMVQVWVPIPRSDEVQTVTDITLIAPGPVKMSRDHTFENQVASFQVRVTNALAVTLRFTVVRRERTGSASGSVLVNGLGYAPYLREERLVTQTPRVRKLADEVTRGKTHPLDQVRALYTYVLKTMRYEKTTPGWGTGDTERACDVHAGNCTDFHSLFVSLCRAKGIPAAFVMGCPLPLGGEGIISGYHCWAEFYIEKKEWMAVDISEAWKRPDRAEQYFGWLDADRVQWTVGRDVVLAPSQKGDPLNYLWGAYVEVDGQPYRDVACRLSSKVVSP